MDPAGFLIRERGVVVREAELHLARLHERHLLGIRAPLDVRQRLDMLYDQLVDAVSARDLVL